MFCKAKLSNKKLFFARQFRPLPNKNVQMLDHFFPLLFPKDSEYLKILDIRLWEVGAKRPLTVLQKWTHRQTDGHTDRQPDISTYSYRKHFEKLWKYKLSFFLICSFSLFSSFCYTRDFWFSWCVFNPYISWLLRIVENKSQWLDRALPNLCFMGL